MTLNSTPSDRFHCISAGYEDNLDGANWRSSNDRECAVRLKALMFLTSTRLYVVRSNALAEGPRGHAKQFREERVHLDIVAPVNEDHASSCWR